MVRRELGVVAILAVIALAGCTRANPDFCASDDDCATGSVCNLTGAATGAKLNECVAFSCSPGESFGCLDLDTAEVCADDGASLETTDCGGFACDPDRGACNDCEPNTVSCGPNADAVDEFVDCGNDGTFNDSRECLLGCSTERVGCNDVDPSNGLQNDLRFIDANPQDVRDLVLGDGFVVNTDNGEIEDATGSAIEAVSTRVEGQGGAPDIQVFRVRSLSIEGDIEVQGDLVAAFVSDRDITINGVIDLTAGDITNQVDQCVGDPPSPSVPESGGGGGGFGENGAPGGDADESGGPGGSQSGNSSLQPIRGGCRGGIAGSGIQRGGLGGGAIQLVARQRIIFGPSGQIDATGKGGGFGGMVTPTAASGGGSGGGVLLESGGITFAGGSFISANGGGGGCAGATGERGRLDRAPAAGASCAGEGNGGNGGAAGSNADPGQDGMGTRGGGGGGAVGRIRINTRPADHQALDVTLISSPDADTADVDVDPNPNN